MIFEIFLAAFGPAQSQFHRRLRAGAVGGVLGAFVESHDNVRAQADLGLHGAFRAEEVR